MKKFIPGLITMIALLMLMPLNMLLSTENGSLLSNNITRQQNGELGIKLEHILSKTISNFSQRKPDLFLITNNNQLTSFREDYIGKNLKPDYEFEVNFQSEVLIALFMGQRSSGGYRIGTEKEALIKNDVLHIKAILHEPEPGTITTQQITSPYTIVSIPIEAVLYFDRIDVKVSSNDKRLLIKDKDDARFSMPPIIDQPDTDIHLELEVKPLIEGSFCLYEGKKPNAILIQNKKDFEKVSDKYFNFLGEEDWIIREFEVDFDKEALVLLMLGENSKMGNEVRIKDEAYIQGKVLRLTVETAEKEDSSTRRQAKSPYAFASIHSKVLYDIEKIVLFNQQNSELASISVSSGDTTKPGDDSNGGIKEDMVPQDNQRYVDFIRLEGGAYSAYDGGKPKIEVVKDETMLESISEEYFSNVVNHEFNFSVDFSNGIVFSLFQGLKSSGGYAILPKTAMVKNGKLVITCIMKEPDPDMIVTMALTSPYTILYIDNSELEGVNEVLLERDEDSEIVAKSKL